GRGRRRTGPSPGFRPRRMCALVAAPGAVVDPEANRFPREDPSSTEAPQEAVSHRVGYRPAMGWVDDDRGTSLNPIMREFLTNRVSLHPFFTPGEPRRPC